MNCAAQPQLYHSTTHTPATLQTSFLDTDAAWNAAIQSHPPSPRSEPSFPGSGQIRPETNHVRKTANNPKIVTSSCFGLCCAKFSAQVMKKNIGTNMPLASNMWMQYPIKWTICILGSGMSWGRKHTITEIEHNWRIFDIVKSSHLHMLWNLPRLQDAGSQRRWAIAKVVISHDVCICIPDIISLILFMHMYIYTCMYVCR